MNIEQIDAYAIRCGIEVIITGRVVAPPRLEPSPVIEGVPVDDFLWQVVTLSTVGDEGQPQIVHVTVHGEIPAFLVPGAYVRVTTTLLDLDLDLRGVAHCNAQEIYACASPESGA